MSETGGHLSKVVSLGDGDGHLYRVVCLVKLIHELPVSLVKREVTQPKAIVPTMAASAKSSPGPG